LPATVSQPARPKRGGAVAILVRRMDEDKGGLRECSLKNAMPLGTRRCSALEVRSRTGSFNIVAVGDFKPWGR